MKYYTMKYYTLCFSSKLFALVLSFQSFFITFKIKERLSYLLPLYYLDKGLLQAKTNLLSPKNYEKGFNP